MSFVQIDDVGTTNRRKLTPHRRLQVWERTGGRCVLCHRKIDGARERWIAEHVRALELGGLDDLDNMGPAHEACAEIKTKDDHRRGHGPNGKRSDTLVPVHPGGPCRLGGVVPGSGHYQE
ncbi:HNH endonuclease [Microvirga sp. GCM10011540]|uniref:HNH endonuclease n=1 Tax=Microvirga sp. GCM10011540 TaxID=3317338 RepID=UPI00360C50D0